jgi:hypothetical protein
VDRFWKVKPPQQQSKRLQCRPYFRPLYLTIRKTSKEINLRQRGNQGVENVAQEPICNNVRQLALFFETLLILLYSDSLTCHLFRSFISFQKSETDRVVEGNAIAYTLQQNISAESRKYPSRTQDSFLKLYALRISAMGTLGPTLVLRGASGQWNHLSIEIQVIIHPSSMHCL